MKKFVAGLSAIALVGALGACGKKAEDNTTALNEVALNETLPADENLTVIDNAVPADAGNIAIEGNGAEATVNTL